MGSLIGELKRREAAARAEADRRRSRIEELSEERARVEEQVSRLVIAREEVVRVMEEPAAAEPPAGQDGKPAGKAGHGPPIGVVTVPPWQEGSQASVLPQSYQDLLEVAADAGRPLRAAEFAAATGLGTDRAKVEGLRSKLKLLAGRGWLAGEPGGPFTLPITWGKQPSPDGNGYVFARRGDERLYAEAKGRMAAIGLDVDTLYGQLLRRMTDPDAGARYRPATLRRCA
jgi:hypothetical protein